MRRFGESYWQLYRAVVRLGETFDEKTLLSWVPSPTTICRVRQKLNLSQREAGGILKVGENVFDKYERGLFEPSGPTSQLLRLLDRHPELVEELRQPSA